MSKHTPGPWVAYARTNAHISIEAPAQSGYVAKAVATVSMNNHEANARLIAAAPDLLEALESIVAMEGTEDNEWDAVDRVIPAMCAKARAAITKATGEKA